MTVELLKKCMPFATDTNINKFVGKLTEAMEKYKINTPARQAAFLAQLAHESGSLKYVEEIASGDAYEGRLDLGNTLPGDGRRYKGRGLIQITGRANYKEVSDALDYDFVDKPEDLELPGPAAFSAAWFWNSRKLNKLADKGEFTKITKIINGGYTGLQDRIKHWARCKEALNIT